MVLLVGLLATSALASPPASDGEPGLSTKIDNRTDPLTEEQTELKAKAMDSVLNGKATTDGKTLEVAKGQFVELAREGEDPVWTVLGEFGDFPHNSIAEPDRDYTPGDGALLLSTVARKGRPTCVSKTVDSPRDPRAGDRCSHTGQPSGAAEDPLELDGSTTPVEKSTTGSYIVVMTADPLLADFDQDELDSNAATKKANGLAKGHDKALEDAGVSTDAKINEYVNALNGFSAVLSYEDALALAADKNVAMVLPDEMQQADTDAVPGFIGLSGPASPWQTGYDGEGVVVGIIDSGIWPEHPSFADDGSFPAPPIELDNSRPSCEFGNSTHNPADVPFECNNKLVGARQMLDTYRALIGATPDEYDSARDDDGHGTHTASTAAGNADVAASIYGAPLPSVSGVAPRAHVIAYKGLGALEDSRPTSLLRSIRPSRTALMSSTTRSAGAPLIPAVTRSPSCSLRAWACSLLRLLATADRVRRPSGTRNHAVDDNGWCEHADPVLPGHGRTRQRRFVRWCIDHPRSRRGSAR